MRKVGIKLGLAAAVVGVGVAGKAEATDRVITTAITTPVETAQPEPPGNVTNGNVTVDPGGSITVTAGQSAITLNSPNNVVNNGGTGLVSSNADNSVGIRIVGGGTGDVTSTGAINLNETYESTDTDSDGDLDTEWAQGTGRFGVYLQAGVAHDGEILVSGATGVEGDASAGIRFDAQLLGNYTQSGNITVIGDTSQAIAINGGLGAGISGDLLITRGAINVRGVDSIGVLVNAPITGELAIGGQINVSGYHSTARPLTQAALDALDPDDVLQSGSAVDIRYSIDGGLTIRGRGVEDDPDDDDDNVDEPTDTDDDIEGSINTFGEAPAIVVRPDASADLTLGTAGYGLVVRGGVSGQGIYDNIVGTGILIEGNAGRTASINQGILNDGSIAAGGIEADSRALVLGFGSIVPEFNNRRLLSATTSSDDPTTAYGLLIESGASIDTIVNTGTISTQAFGENSNARSIVDQAGTIDTITNRGTIAAETFPTDDDPDDDVVPPALGDTIAIDLSLNGSGVLLEQLPDVVFTDDDGVDDDVGSRPQVRIIGDVLFGAGADQFNLYAGTMQGDLDFGGGGDLFFIDNGASFTGRLSGTPGGLDVDVINGSMTLNGGVTDLATATFRANSELSVLLSTVPAESTFIHATGAIVFENGAALTAFIPQGLPSTGSSIFLTADGGLTGAAFVSGPVSGGNTPYIYNIEIDTVLGDPDSLEARYDLKTAAELGLNPNEEAAFLPIVEALRQSDAASAAFAGLTSQLGFETALDDLLPSFSRGATELAATAVQQSQSAATNRLAATRLRDVDDTSVWVQEIGYGLTRDPLNNGIEFRGYGFGLAGGIDAPLDNGALFGLAASFIASQVEEPGRPDGEIAAAFGQANAYLGTALGPFDLDFVGGLGVGRMSSRRVIEIGTGFQETTEADWWAYEAHGAARASLPLALTDWFIVTPQVALTYMALNEQGYEEEGGGAAFDLEADSATTQRLWGDAGIEFSGRWRLRGEGQIAPRIFLGYRTNVLDDDEERTFRFAGGSDFTLSDPSTGESAPLVGIGIDATNGFSTFSLSYEGELGDELERHSLNAAIRFRF